VFSHNRDLLVDARPDGPDAAFARRLQEALGGRWGEFTAATQYLLQGWSCRLPGKYRDLLLDVGTEEMAHVELICTMITRLLADAPLSVQEAAAQDNPTLAVIYGGALPAQTIVAGGAALPVDSSGLPWSGSYVTVSGNLLADFQLNITVETQSRLQLARLFQMTDDPGVKQLLRFLIARDSAHLRRWQVAIGQLREEGLEDLPVPDAFPDTAAAMPPAHGSPNLPPGDPRLYCT
jgi:Mn-containing catalase